MNMNKYDSLGAQQLPDEPPTPVAVDWQENPLYEGEFCFLTPEGYVRDEDALEYVETTFPQIELGGN